MAGGVVLDAVARRSGRGVHGYDRSAGAAATAVRSHVLVKREAPFHIRPRPVAHHLRDLFKVSLYLV